MTVPETSRSVETLLYCRQVFWSLDSSVETLLCCPQVFLSLDSHGRVDISAHVKTLLELKNAEGSSQRAANDSNTC